MPTPSIAFPSGSTGGAPIQLTTSATSLHTTPSTTGLKSEIYLWLSRTDTASATTVTVTVTVGAVTWSVLTVAALAGPYLVLPGLRLGPGIAVTATASVADKVTAILNVNEVSP